jgi:hypothetical protein
MKLLIERAVRNIAKFRVENERLRYLCELGSKEPAFACLMDRVIEIVDFSSLAERKGASQLPRNATPPCRPIAPNERNLSGEPPLNLL